jgi:hypothetical protein
MAKVDAFLRALRMISEGLNPSKQAKNIAEKTIRKSGVKPDTTRNYMFTEFAPDTPIIAGSKAGSQTVIPEPGMLSFTQMPKTTAKQRMLRNELARQRKMSSQMFASEPMLRQYRNTNLGLGVGLGALPPSLYALYLLSQDDEE